MSAIWSTWGSSAALLKLPSSLTQCHPTTSSITLAIRRALFAKSIPQTAQLPWRSCESHCTGSLFTEVQLDVPTQSRRRRQHNEVRRRQGSYSALEGLGSHVLPVVHTITCHLGHNSQAQGSAAHTSAVDLL
eukprot:4915469-Amphidinium_carterae.1